MKRVLLLPLQLFLTAPLFLVATLLFTFVTILGSWLFGSRFWGDYPGRIWGRFTCLLSFHRITVSGRENIDPEQSYIFMANHQGAFDIFLIYGFLNHPFRWIMKQGLRHMPLIGSAGAVTGQIFVNHKKPASIKQAMQQAKEHLESGTSIVIFPEGRRTQSGRMGNFKRGGFQIALELGLPIIPLTVEGAYEAMPRGQFKMDPSHLKLTIHPPILTHGMSPDQINDLIHEVHQTIASSLPEHRR